MNNESTLFADVQNALSHPKQEWTLRTTNDHASMEFPLVQFSIHNVITKHEIKTMHIADYMVQVDIYTEFQSQGKLFELKDKVLKSLRSLENTQILDMGYDIAYSQENTHEELLNRCTLTIHYKINEGDLQSWQWKNESNQ